MNPKTSQCCRSQAALPKYSLVPNHSSRGCSQSLQMLFYIHIFSSITKRDRRTAQKEQTQTAIHEFSSLLVSEPALSPSIQTLKSGITSSPDHFICISRGDSVSCKQYSHFPRLESPSGELLPSDSRVPEDTEAIVCSKECLSSAWKRQSQSSGV